MLKKSAVVTNIKIIYCFFITVVITFSGAMLDWAYIKKDIIEHLWKVIISDNTVDQYESNLMRRICGLIYFPDKECAEIKLRMLNNKWLT